MQGLVLDLHNMVLYAHRNKTYRILPSSDSQRLGNRWNPGLLFYCLLDTYFYAKNARGQSAMVNRAIALMFGSLSPEDRIGKTDHDLLGIEIGASVHCLGSRRDDARVRKSPQSFAQKDLALLVAMKVNRVWRSRRRHTVPG